MTDPYADFATSLVAPAAAAFAITPGASDLSQVTRAIYVGTGGDLEVKMVLGQTVMFENVVAGAVLPIRCIKVLAGTTAQSIVGLY